MARKTDQRRTVKEWSFDMKTRAGNKFISAGGTMIVALNEGDCHDAQALMIMDRAGALADADKYEVSDLIERTIDNPQYGW